jgi:prevent-host-death family protein
MDTMINMHEAKTQLSKLVERVRAGERIVIAKSGKPMAVLEAYRETLAKRPIGMDEGKVIMHDDFDDPIPELEELTI